MTILEKLDELKRLADAATPGPWSHDILGPHRQVNSRAKPGTVIFYRNEASEGNTESRNRQAPQDFSFAAASRTAMPQLVEALIYAIDILGEEKRLRGIDRIAEILEVKG